MLLFESFFCFVVSNGHINEVIDLFLFILGQFTPDNASKFMNGLMNDIRQTIQKNPDMKLNNLFRD
jgi:hypothetical protein